MRDPIENISHLQAQLNDLQLENQILKNILDNAGISYTQEIMRLRATEELCDYDANQGARIQFPSEITEKWQLCSIPDSGEDRMYMQKEMRKRIRVSPDIFHSAIIFGQKYVIESENKMLIVVNVNIGRIRN